MYSGVRLLDHMVALFLAYKVTFILFSIVTISIYLPTNSRRRVPIFLVLFLKPDSVFSYMGMWIFGTEFQL